LYSYDRKQIFQQSAQVYSHKQSQDKLPLLLKTSSNRPSLVKDSPDRITCHIAMIQICPDDLANESCQIYNKCKQQKKL
jgi:hypothetical protein